jgi:hypothetical protein
MCGTFQAQRSCSIAAKTKYKKVEGEEKKEKKIRRDKKGVNNYFH